MSGARYSSTALAAAMLLAALAAPPALADETQVAFDPPDAIECRDVTPKSFAAANPSLKVIEARFRISARITAGSETSLVDFLYVVTSPGLRLRIKDFLPNTTLESTKADDRIEVTATTEHSDAVNEDAHVAYKVLGLGGTKNDTSKKTESDHYKEIVPRALVLASGTMNREHGVFYKLQPSKEASLEGAKAFTILAVVDKTWRGDWCVISCAARAKKKSFFSDKIETAGVDQTHVGMYLAGDREARFRAEELCEVQQAGGSVLLEHLSRHRNALVEAMHAATESGRSSYAWLEGIFGLKPGGDQVAEKGDADPDADQRRTELQQEINEVQEQLNRLGGSRI